MRFQYAAQNPYYLFKTKLTMIYNHNDLFKPISDMISNTICIQTIMNKYLYHCEIIINTQHRLTLHIMVQITVHSYITVRG